MGNRSTIWKKLAAIVLSFLFVGTAFAGGLAGFSTSWTSGGETIVVSTWCTGEYAKHCQGIHNYFVKTIMELHPPDPPKENAVAEGEGAGSRVFEQRMIDPKN